MTNKLVGLFAMATLHSIEAKDLPHIIQEAATIAKTATPSEQQQQQIYQLFLSLLDAIQLAFRFFKSMFSFLLNCILTVLTPVTWIAHTVWSNFVAKPFGLFMAAAHIVYPVILFCIAAVACGLFIGGCAGFAAEAFSSLLISATWGPQPVKPKETSEMGSVIEDDLHSPDNQSLIESEEEEEEIEQERPTLKSTPGSSIFGGSSFFGMHPTSQKKQEKSPIIQKPKVEDWRESVASPVMIRKRRLNSPKKTDDWDWDEHEHESSAYQVPSSSSSLYRS